MKRATLKNEFHGEPDPAEEGAAVASQGPDDVTIDITRGTLTLRVPPQVPDSHVLDNQYLDQFLQLVVDLEDGSQLTIILNEDHDGVDVRRETRQAVEQKSASRLEAEKSPGANKK